jgi:hypothetical protein
MNTNGLVVLDTTSQPPFVYTENTYYFDKNGSPYLGLYGWPCFIKSETVPAGFYSLSDYSDESNHIYWPYHPPDFEPSASAMVDGFFAGCTPLDALLASTFDCLYNISCLEIFSDYFPGLNNVCIMQYLMFLYKNSFYLDNT